MAGSAFYGYHIAKLANGRAVVVRNTGPAYGANYYRTKTKALAAAAKHNRLMRRVRKANPRASSLRSLPSRAVNALVKQLPSGKLHIHILTGTGTGMRKRKRRAASVSRRRRR